MDLLSDCIINNLFVISDDFIIKLSEEIDNLSQDNFDKLFRFFHLEKMGRIQKNNKYDKGVKSMMNIDEDKNLTIIDGEQTELS
jgi:hypothetical protein